MAGPLLRSEPLQRYRALGMAGDPVWRAAGQLRAAIAQRLSREHADLLAIPEVEPSGRRIDWYAPFDGDPKRLADLGEAERAQVLDKVRRLHADMAGLAASMEAPERSGAERNFARLLRHALTAPGEETLHVVDGKPVMTFWGFAADAALPGVFIASPPQPPRPLAAPMPQAVMASAPAVAAMATGTRSAMAATARCFCARRPRLAAAALPATSRTAPRSQADRPSRCSRSTAAGAHDAQQDNERLGRLARLRFSHRGGTAPPASRAGR
jgi:hypothetical protein